MVWFKVDDGFHSHPKAFHAGTAALGLWVRAGSWAASQLTDGFVPAEVVRMYGTPAMAKALVTVGLWTKAEGGYWFHQWSDDGRQPTRQQVEAERTAARERMKKRREPRRSDGDSPADVQANAPGDNPRSSGNDARNSEDVREPRPGPTRPGTYLLTLISRLAAGDARGGPPPAEVIESWQEIAGPEADLNAEAASYLSRFGDRPAERRTWCLARLAAQGQRPPPGHAGRSGRRYPATGRLWKMRGRIPRVQRRGPSHPMPDLPTTPSRCGR